MTPLQEIFIPSFCVGGLVSAVMAFIGGRLSGITGPLILLFMSTFVCWLTLFLGLEVGYHVWHSRPNPPPEAFSDTAPMGALFAGWIPGGFFACFWFGTSWLIKKFVWNLKLLYCLMRQKVWVNWRLNWWRPIMPISPLLPDVLSVDLPKVSVVRGWRCSIRIPW
ncbi:MAG: hypothetical protein CMM01_08590 [Rhodopirellula sp.]|nr:hypothetical protein [Rhodopirellula sp.]